MAKHALPRPAGAQHWRASGAMPGLRRSGHRWATAVGLGVVVAVLALPPVPILRPAVVIAFWVLWSGGCVRYAVSGAQSVLAPGAVNAATGLALLCVGSESAVALGLDHPVRGTQALAVLGALCLLRPPSDVALHGRWYRSSQAPRRLAFARPGPTARTAPVLLLVALSAWLVSLGQADLSKVDDFGLLPALPPLWYVALLLAVVTTAWAALDRAPAHRPVVLGAGLVLLVLILHATPAALYDLPRYTWTYKHLGVVDHIARFHDLPRTSDIYYNWPGFFTAAHWLADAADVAPQTLARWAPPAFELLNALAVWHLVTAFTADRRRAALATLLFVVSVWVGQDYFSPQAMAYVLALVLVALVVRRNAGDPTRSEWVVVGLLWAAVVTSHQLTPVITFTVLLALQVLLRWRSWSLLVAMAAVELAWVALAWPYLRDSGYRLLQLNPFHGSASQGREHPQALGLIVRGAAVHGIYFALFGLGVGYALWRGGRNRLELALGGAALAPALVLLVQDYGGEGQLRTYLFALPFLVLLVAGLLGRFRWPGWAAYAAALGALALFLPAYLGQDQVNRVVPGDLAAARWFYDHSAAGAEPIFMAPNAPSRMTSQYLEHPVQGDAGLSLLSDRRFERELTADAAMRYLRTRVGPTYLLVSDSQIDYATYFGIMDREGYERLCTQLDAEAGLRLVFRQGAASVWERVQQ